MQLNDLKTAWQQLKLITNMEPMEVSEILSIIDNHAHNKKKRLQGVLLNVAMFIVLMICCQGG